MRIYTSKLISNAFGTGKETCYQLSNKCSKCLINLLNPITFQMEAHRNLFLLSPPFMHMFQSRLALPPNSVSSDQKCPRSKSNDSRPNTPPPRKTTTATCATQEHSTSSSTSTAEVDRDRSRKHTVFSMGRVFSHLMGRGSLPPDLPSNSSGSSVTVKERGMSTDRLSLKKVFKKRSV